MPKYMGNIYKNRNTMDLRRLRSKKYNRLTTLESRRMGWFDLREADSLRSNIRDIDAELESRRSQLPLELE